MNNIRLNFLNLASLRRSESIKLDLDIHVWVEVGNLCITIFISNVGFYG